MSPADGSAIPRIERFFLTHKSQICLLRGLLAGGRSTEFVTGSCRRRAHTLGMAFLIDYLLKWSVDTEAAQSQVEKRLIFFCGLFFCAADPSWTTPLCSPLQARSASE